MPVQRCEVGGEPGWRWGQEGKCYTGADAKQRAINQGLAIGGGKLDKLRKRVKLPPVGDRLGA